MLTEWFTLNRNDPEANKHLYNDILKYYTWNSTKKTYIKRKNKMTCNPECEFLSDTISRIPVVSLSVEKEKFYLRILLYNIPGAKSFQDIKTVFDEETNIPVVCKDFMTTCMKRKFIEDDKEYVMAMEEASNLQFGRNLRQFFVSLILYAMPADTLELWNLFKTQLCEDFLRKARPRLTKATEEVFNKALIDIQSMLESQGKNLKMFGLPEPISEDQNIESKEIQIELNNYNSSLELKAAISISTMNAEQWLFYSRVIKAVKSGKSEMFILDAPGGTGKTYTLIAILDSLRSDNKICLCMATTGRFYEHFVHKSMIVKHQTQSEVNKLMLYVSKFF